MVEKILEEREDGCAEAARGRKIVCFYFEIGRSSQTTFPRGDHIPTRFA